MTSKNTNKSDGGTGKKFFHRLSTLLVIALAVLAVVVMTTMEDGRHFASLRRWLMYGDSGTTKDVYLYAADPNNQFASLGNSLLVVSPNTAQLIGDDGMIVYEQRLNMVSPQLTVGGGLAAVCDIGGDTIYILDQTGVLRTMQTEHGLCYYSARINGSGYLAVTEQKGGYKASISVYNRAGDLTFHFDSYDNYISDAVVTDDCRSVVMASLESQDGAFASRLLMYDLESASLTGSSTLRDGLVMDFVCAGRRILSLCDKRFAITDLAGEVLLNRSYGNLYLHDYALTGDGFCALLLGRYQAGNICTLTTYDMDGSEIASLDLTEEVLDMSAAGNSLAVLYGDSLVVYDKNLEERASLTGTDYAGQIQMEEKGSVLMIAGTSAWRFLP